MATAKTYPPIILGFFARGYCTNRQPLFSAMTNVGLQVVQFKDYLIDGINVECTDRFTLQRAPGFTKYCSQQLATSEVVNQFYDTRDLNGNVYTLADTNQNLYTVTPSSLTSILTKGTTAQGFTQQIGGVTYYSNGTDLKKWIPPASSMVPWGIAAPGVITIPGSSTAPAQPGWAAAAPFFTAPCSLLDSNGNIEYQTSAGNTSNSLAVPIWNTVLGGSVTDGTCIWQNVGPAGNWVASNVYTTPTVITDTNNFLQLVTTAGTSDTAAPAWNTTVGGTTTDAGVTWTNIGPGVIIAFSGYGYVAAFRTVTGNLSTASPAVFSGPLKASVPSSPISVTAWSFTGGVATFTANNNLIAGTSIIFSGFTGAGAAIWNGSGGTVLSSGLSSTVFKITVGAGTASGTDPGIAMPVLAIVHGALGTSNPECTSSASVTSVQVTNRIATITAANNFTSGITVVFQSLSSATFLNGVQFSVESATPTEFTVSVPDQTNYGPTTDSGSATFLAIEIYRTQDGGGVFYFDGALQNSGPVSGWNFEDYASDAQLVTELVCPPASNHLNDPPPGQIGSTQSLGGTIIVWWSNRIWMAVGNLLYFSGGPDILNGIPEECFPPANVFVFPGVISSLNPTTGGLVVVIPDEVWAILGGPQTLTYYPDRILTHFGALSPNCVKQDGDTIYLYSSGKQLTVLSGTGKAELGSAGTGICPVGDVLANGISTLSVTASAWSPTASYIALHRQGEDSGIYFSNAIDSIIRYGANVGNFSPIRQPFVNGAAVSGPIASVETSAGQYSLLFSPITANDYIYARDLASFTDNANTYASNAVIGNIMVTEPGQPLAPLQFLAAYLYNRGSIPSMSIFLNDIAPSLFIALPTVQNEPVFLAPSVNLMSKRWPVMMNQVGKTILVRHLQVKVDFGATDTVQNELIELALRFDTEQMV